MVDVLVAPDGLIVLLGLLLLTAVGAQALGWQMIHTRYGRFVVYRGYRRIFEGAVVGYLVTQVVAFGQLLSRASDSVFDPGSQVWRWAAWALLVVVTLAGRRLRREPGALAVVAVTALTTPAVDRLPGPTPFVLLVLVLLFLIVRAVVITVEHYLETHRGISALSVQEAIDRLPTGLMFVQSNGAVALINARMRTLMSELTGRVYRHGAGFLSTLSERTASDRTVQHLDSAPLFRLTDGTYWMLQQNEVTVDDRPHLELVATNITLRWQLVQELQEAHDQLEIGIEQLQNEFDAVVAACTADELLRARTRVHDVIGQRTSMLLRMLRSDTVPDRAALVDLTRDLRTDLSFEPPTRTPWEELELLRTGLAGIGVTLRGPDDLVVSEKKSRMIVDIVREAASNAIKHGSATEIAVDVRRGTGECFLTVRDNGISGAEEIVEGGGLGGMRYRLEKVGGQLEIQTAPQFVVRATIPEV